LWSGFVSVTYLWQSPSVRVGCIECKLTCVGCAGGRVHRRHDADGIAAGQGRVGVPALVLGAGAGRPPADDHQGHRHVLHARRRRLLLQAAQVGYPKVQKASLQTRL
jgi:hypothetical protein